MESAQIILTAYSYKIYFNAALNGKVNTSLLALLALGFKVTTA